MANHLGRSVQSVPKQEAPKPDVPVLKWATIAKLPDGFCLAVMTTQGSKILEQSLGKVEAHRPFVEDEFRIWCVYNVLDRGEG